MQLSHSWMSLWHVHGLQSLSLCIHILIAVISSIFQNFRSPLPPYLNFLFSCPLPACCNMLHSRSMYSPFHNFRAAMHLAVVPAPRSIQQLLAPIIAIDRVQQEMEKCLYELSDVEDDLLDLNIYGVPPMLRNLTHQLRMVITQVKIHKLRLLCQLQRSIYLQWRHHQCFPWLDLDL